MRWMKNILVVFCLFFASPGLGKQIIPAWNYYLYPPFITEHKQGLVYQFINQLNLYSDKQYKFRLKNIGKKSVDKRLAQGRQGIVLFVNEQWMESSENIYLWSEPIMKGENVLISNIANRVEYNDLSSLAGLRLGGIFGRQYKGLDGLVKNKLITRYDVSTEQDLLNLLVYRRVDIINMPRLVSEKLIQQLDLGHQVYVSSKPLYRFTRNILITNELPHIKKHINQFILTLKEEPDWKTQL